MTIPTFVTASTGATDAGGAWTCTGSIASAVGNTIVLHVVQDGAGVLEVTLTSGTNIEDLAGTDDAWTKVGSWGEGVAVSEHIWIGRAINTSAAPTATGGNSGTDDLYFRMYEFSNVATGTTLGSVVENAAAALDFCTQGGTSATAEDQEVQTTAADRLALNFLGINDDNPFAGFTGQTGGTWVTKASYASATGTDGALYLVSADMAAAGTINGGTGSITDSDSWRIVGWALIGATTPPPSDVFGTEERFYLQAVNTKAVW